MKRLRKSVFLLGILVSVRWLYRTNVHVQCTKYRLSFRTLPQSFHGFKIAHLSDFHNRKFGNVTAQICQRLRTEKPDIIVITGDLIDSRNPNVAIALAFVRELTTIAPCYYVPGNHEARLYFSSHFSRLLNGLKRFGVEILRNRNVCLTKQEETITIAGVDDPLFTKKLNGRYEPLKLETINQFVTEDAFSILLSHRPEYFTLYKHSRANLVFSGHAHGGQFRLPFIGGLFAPHQGFFPTYDAGVFQADEFALVVSRGIGNSVLQLRLNNQPEIVIVELAKK